MRVTVMADASYCPDTKIAGYGFWIASERAKFPGDGVMKDQCVDNVVAEMRAVCYALHYGLTRQAIDYDDKVLIQIDCQAAIDAFMGTREVGKQQEKDTLAYFNTLCRNSSLHIEWRHVKGHTSTDDARSKSNNSCDRRARNAMRAARDRVLAQQLQEQIHATQAPSERHP